MPEEILINKGAFRIKDWWWSKAALLMGMVYLFTIWFCIPFEKFGPLALLSLVTIVGFASFGYLMNDFFDIRQDLLAGKSNFLAGKPAIIVAFLFLSSLSLILMPWLFLPADRFSFILIIIQLFLFLIYSVPPIRLKEHGLAGILVDSMYAHALPTTLAAYTFSLAVERSGLGFEVVLLFAWQFANGVRNILIHQQQDLAADRRSGSKSFSHSLSETGFVFSIRYLIITELFFCICFFATLSLSNLLFIPCILLLSVMSTWVMHLFHKKGISSLLQSNWRYFPNNMYEKWLPPLFLILAIYSDKRFTIILLIHILLFNFDLYRQLFLRLRAMAKNLFAHINLVKVRILIIGSVVVNYSIYYLLLLFGIDLKKENSSALSYFKKRWSKN